MQTDKLNKFRACAGGCGVSIRIAARACASHTRATLFEFCASPHCSKPYIPKTRRPLPTSSFRFARARIERRELVNRVLVVMTWIVAQKALGLQAKGLGGLVSKMNGQRFKADGPRAHRVAGWTYYSYLKAWIGSSLAAFNAGNKPAT